MTVDNPVGSGGTLTVNEMDLGTGEPWRVDNLSMTLPVVLDPGEILTFDIVATNSVVSLGGPDHDGLLLIQSDDAVTPTFQLAVHMQFAALPNLEVRDVTFGTGV